MKDDYENLEIEMTLTVRGLKQMSAFHWNVEYKISISLQISYFVNS
jgi:hypothetical protein